MPPKSTTDYEVIAEGRGKIVVGTFNFHLMGTSRPATHEYGGKTYLFSQQVPVPDEFEHRVCAAAEYKLASQNPPNMLELTAAHLRSDPGAPGRIVRNPYFQARDKKRWGFIKLGWLSLPRKA